ncbi:MAG: XRE family transcriptional regulator [Sporomusaceae bacterium]|nr:XRE family transcriptional regulator [Sporomusaceae bacterium]
MEKQPNIGARLKATRRKRHLSLDKVAELTGVSKTMLGQIERGESSPTLNTLWKIATGLKVSFSSLVSEPIQQTDCSSGQFVGFSAIQALAEDKGLLKIYPQFSFDSMRGFEMFLLELEPGCNHHSEAHDDGVEEYIMVLEGEITIGVAAQEYRLKKGDVLRYFANQPHCYQNLSKQQASFYHLIYYMS